MRAILTCAHLLLLTVVENVEQGGILLKGGGQMKGLRSGTENVPYIAGMGAAATEVAKGLKYVPKYETIKSRLVSSLRGSLPQGERASCKVTS